MYRMRVGTTMRIAVIGAGVVGSTVAAHLASMGHDVIVVEMGRRLRDIERRGLLVEGALACTARPSSLYDRVEALAGSFLDWALICTKTYSLADLAPRLAASLAGDVRVAAVQNGVDPEELLAMHVGRRRTYRVLVNFAGSLTEEGSVRVCWAQPPNALGPLEQDQGEGARLAEALTASGLSTQPLHPEETKKEAFRRAILSAALAPVCALTGLPMGAAMRLPAIRSLAERLAHEGFAVAQKLGYSFGPDAVASCLRYLEAGGNHMPSMWWDLLHNGRTEIEAISGRIAALGAQLGVDVTANSTLHALIVAREHQVSTRIGVDAPCPVHDGGQHGDPFAAELSGHTAERSMPDKHGFSSGKTRRP